MQNFKKKYRFKAYKYISFKPIIPVWVYLQEELGYLLSKLTPLIIAFITSTI